MSIYDDEIITDITESVQKLLGTCVKYAAIGVSDEKRMEVQDDLIAINEHSMRLNPDWNGQVYIQFENGAEITVCGSDYVSVHISKKQ